MRGFSCEPNEFWRNLNPPVALDEDYLHMWSTGEPNARPRLWPRVSTFLIAHRSFLIAYRPLARLRALCLGIPSERPESQSLWGSSFVATGSPGALGAFFVYWLGRCCPKEVCAPYWFRQHVKGGRNGLALLSDNVVLSGHLTSTRT